MISFPLLFISELKQQKGLKILKDNFLVSTASEGSGQNSYTRDHPIIRLVVVLNDCFIRESCIKQSQYFPCLERNEPYSPLSLQDDSSSKKNSSYPHTMHFLNTITQVDLHCLFFLNFFQNWFDQFARDLKEKQLHGVVQELRKTKSEVERLKTTVSEMRKWISGYENTFASTGNIIANFIDAIHKRKEKFKLQKIFYHWKINTEVEKHEVRLPVLLAEFLHRIYRCLSE